MRSVESLSHTRWECKYHIVFIPKYRRKNLFGQIRKELGGVFHRLAKQKESLIEEGHIMADHVHMMISIPPKYAVSFIIGFVKGKSAVRIHRELLKERRMTGLHFWASGYWVSTVGRDEAAVRGARSRRGHPVPGPARWSGAGDCSGSSPTTPLFPFAMSATASPATAT